MSEISASAPQSFDSAKLADHTTARVGGTARYWVKATTEEQLIDAIRQADANREPLLVLGGGSNVLVADEGFPGTVVHIGTQGITVLEQTPQSVLIRVDAGQNWDDVVAHTVAKGWSGLEALSGIPGAAGATPVQNVGAYGAEVADTLVSIRAWDRQQHRIVELSNQDLDFGYRDSIIKRTVADSIRDPMAATPRWVVLSVDFQLANNQQHTPVRYSQLARALGVELGDEADIARVREEVLKLRASKGMVLDETDHDTWSTGSFFTNPIVPAEQTQHLPEEAPQFPAGTNESGQPLVKLSAAWLIDHAGYHKGFGAELTGGRASLSTKHTLALTNRGSATTADLITVAQAVRDGVQKHWKIALHPEPVLIGCRV